ncbi:MAG: hypothetical protein PBV01_24380 [Brucella anthropi]
MKLVRLYKASDGSLKTIGNFIGELGQIGGKGIELFAKSISIVVQGLADLAKWAAGPAKSLTGSAYFLTLPVRLVNLLATGVEKLWNLLTTPIQIPALAWDMLSTRISTLCRDKIKSGIDTILAKLQSLAAAILRKPLERCDCPARASSS